MIDNDVLFNRDMPCYQKNDIVFKKISYELSKYPLQWSAKSFQILHITRDSIVTKERYPRFRAYTLSYDCSNWERKEIEIPTESGILCVFGSGKTEFINNYQRYQDSYNKNTSRNVFHCFVDTLNNIHDPYCGGAPQLVGIYRKPNSCAKYFGIIYNSKRYIAGSEVPYGSNYNSVDWRNENFERCDGEDKKIKTVKEWETINSMIPMWRKSKSDLTEEDYNKFYKDMFYDFQDPFMHMHYQVEGLIDYKALIYIPTKQPETIIFHPLRYQRVTVHIKPWTL
jgi:hypothetical protein